MLALLRLRRARRRRRLAGLRVVEGRRDGDLGGPALRGGEELVRGPRLDARRDVGDDDALRALELREGGDVALGERGLGVPSTARGRPRGRRGRRRRRCGFGAP